MFACSGFPLIPTLIQNYASCDTRGFRTNLSWSASVVDGFRAFIAPTFVKFSPTSPTVSKLRGSPVLQKRLHASHEWFEFSAEVLSDYHMVSANLFNHEHGRSRFHVKRCFIHD